MKNLVMDKQLVSEWLDDLVERYTVFAPLRVSTDLGTTLFGLVEEPELVDIAAGRTRNSAKEALFPQVAELLEFSGEGDFLEGDRKPAKPILLFGVTPCDARAFECLDRPFLEEEPKDNYYSTRRSDAVVVSLACNHPWRSCFCDALGSGPFSVEGTDLQLVDLGESLLLMPLTEEGRKLAGTAPGTEEAGEEELERREELEIKAEGELTGFPKDDAISALRGVGFEDPLWDSLHLACLGCGACTYNCPTCHCFDITDELRGDEGRRFRVWDTCQFPLFTLHASGHNPRPTDRERVRQRILHKFQYFPQRYEGTIGCVGCGRCVEVCPVNLDLREIVDILARSDRTQ